MKPGDRYRNAIGEELEIETNPFIVTGGHDHGPVIRIEQVRFRFLEGRCKGEYRQWATSYIEHGFAKVTE